jgi:hypothetical protein
MFVNGGVAGEFGMEGGGEDFAFLDESGLAPKLGEDGDVGGDFFNDRAANENHFEWLLLERAGTEEDVAGELAAVAIAKNGHIQELEGILRGIFHLGGQENGSGAGAEDGVAVGGKVADGVVEAFFLEELELRGAFAAREDEAIAAIEVDDCADFDGVDAELVEHGGVGLEISLDGEYADFHKVVARESVFGNIWSCDPSGAAKGAAPSG